MEQITAKGLRMPRLGLGTYRLQGADCQAAVESALALGYRHIDTAEMYGNEDAVGAALSASGVGRDQVHLTTKVWHDHLAPERMRAALEASLSRLGTDDVDLYMIHWPAPGADIARALEALARLKQDGLVRAIGVCNFPTALLRLAVEQVGAPIAVVQVEYHALLGQDAVLGYARSHGLALTAYCPLAQGRLAGNETLSAIGRRHGASAAQVALAWLLGQPDVAAIPKASRRESQLSNLQALELSLDKDDRDAIAALPKTQRLVNPGFAPAWDQPAWDQPA